jgi:hypothetical protein
VESEKLAGIKKKKPRDMTILISTPKKVGA